MIYRLESTDGVNWSNRVPISVIGTYPEGKVQWHLDALYDSTSGEYIILLVVTTEAGMDTSLVMLSSTDGLHWYTDGTYLIDASPVGWDDLAIYRSCGVRDGDLLRIWYSGYSRPNPFQLASHSHVGYTEVHLYHDSSGRLRASSVSALPWQIDVDTPTTFEIAGSGGHLTATLSDYDGPWYTLVTAVSMSQSDHGDTVLAWSAAGPATYTVTGLRIDTTYQVLMDGQRVATISGSDPTFTVAAGGEYEIQVWEPIRSAMPALEMAIKFAVMIAIIGAVVTMVGRIKI